MAANRPTWRAPKLLTQMSKTTLADLVWDLAAHAAPHVDDEAGMCRVILERVKLVQAPSFDVRLAERMQFND